MNSTSAIAGLILIAAPGDQPPALSDVPELARAAIARRLHEQPSTFHIEKIAPSTRSSGFVVCGTVQKPAATGVMASEAERFFVVVPGDFAILDTDGRLLVDRYWSLNHC